ncbi:hypothetical protein TELCIR_10918 [Teladorsagia circumcincta]|uniref:Teneurin-1-4-like galactose-binding domain-containing protein n=1 Tax=Teladorsagia circumcincta TaxID=45464 RepID=A0A2G9UC78_TELCI|nr:hypothetical protein TELCIR_10918 [Teladorsagia circumcincta]
MGHALENRSEFALNWVLGQCGSGSLGPASVESNLYIFRNSELFITRAGRVAFNVSVGAGAQMVLLGRHAVPPSLSLHDFYHPLRADRLAPPSPSHSIETARHKRQTPEMLVEPISLLAYSIAAPTSSSADGTNPLAIRCDADCNGHGECLSGGRCRNAMCMHIGAKFLTVAVMDDVVTRACAIVIKDGPEKAANWVFRSVGLGAL